MWNLIIFVIVVDVYLMACIILSMLLSKLPAIVGCGKCVNI